MPSATLTVGSGIARHPQIRVLCIQVLAVGLSDVAGLSGLLLNVQRGGGNTLDSARKPETWWR
jgi:hypothetical protein